MGQDQRHYNIEKLNRIFALASLLLLVCLMLLFGKDYSREWKKYQNEFQGLEIEKTRVKYDLEATQLDKNAEYQEIIKKYADVEKIYDEKCASKDSEKELNTLRAHDDLVQQEYKFARAELDAARYRYETAEAHHGQNAEEAQKKFLDLDQKVENLKMAIDQSQTALKEKEKIIEDCAQDIKTVEKEKHQLTAKKEIIERKLKGIDPYAMNFTNQIADMVRDLPMIDLANPKFKVKQIVLKDLRDDVNFVTVPKVDRCTTCHLGIANPDYQNAQQPYRTHPNLELYIGKDSPHPLDEFGCTVCHGGRGRSTSFSGSIHTPSSPEQKEEWEKKYNWHKVELWEQPMLPMPYVEAGCFKCHSGETSIKGADKLNLGLQIIERAGCYGCHTIEKYKDWPKPGPDLTKISSKLSKDWVYKWIADPRSFHHNTWMPSFFHQSNNSDPESRKRTEQEIHAMTAYLFAMSDQFAMSKPPVQGDPKKGEELVSSLGCLACHRLDEKSEDTVTKETLRQEHGPNLLGLGSKTSKEWIYTWLKNPPAYHSDTKMPNFRLSDEEASDISAFLTSGTNKEFENQIIPPVNEEAINTIILEFLTTTESHESAQKTIFKMNLDDKLKFAGEKLIGHYGCFGCHNIKGFEKVKPIGIELTEEGSKSLHNLDFGFIHVDHSNHAWFTQKLKDPRIFDEGKVKAHYEKLVMPNFYLSNQEAEAVVTAILGFVKQGGIEAKKKTRTPQNIVIEEGQELVRQFNCQACHVIEGEGGTIQSSIEDWLMTSKNVSEGEAKAMINSFSPPNLIGQGKKVHAEWLFEFLHSPTPIRPWLNVRMPTYNFNAAHLNTLVKYFNTIDNEDFPFTEEVNTSLSPEEYKDAEKLFSNDNFGCAQCHIVGDKMPSGSPESWAPNFALAKSRLKPGWISKWLENPQALLPGTKMPTYFDPQSFDASGPEDIAGGDEHEQIRLLRNYLMTLSGPQETQKSQKEDKITPKEMPEEPLGQPAQEPAVELPAPSSTTENLETP